MRDIVYDKINHKQKPQATMNVIQSPKVYA